jgi:murein DD-endopeptidase MepM/ murein hydrolase activator NlpD
MSVLGDSTRKSSPLFVVTLALVLCFGSVSSASTNKGKYKSLDRLKAGLRSVRTAKEAATVKLTQLQAEHKQLSDQKSFVKVHAFEEETIRDADQVRPEVQQLADRVLKPTPPNTASLRRRLHQQLAEGEIKLLAELLIGKRTVITTADVEEAVEKLPSIDAFRKVVGATKLTTPKTVESEDTDQARRDEVAEQIEFLKAKIAKCERDEKHIRAEIRVVSNQGDQDELTPSRSAQLLRPIDTRQTSSFGMRMHPIHNEERMHKGLDFAGPYGTRVNSAAAGRVTFSGELSGFGNIVIIEHREGFETAYAHLSQLNVEVGDRIGAGYKIGEVGSSGMSTGPHLHFEVRVNGKQVDPADYL